MVRALSVAKGIFLAAALVVLMFPIYLMVENSFTPAMAFLKSPPDLLPYEFTLANYQRIFSNPLLGRWAVNSVIVIVITVVTGILVNCSAGYVFTYGKGKYLNIIFWLFLAPMFVTRYVLIISQFIVIKQLNVHGLMAVILMPLFWPTGIYLSRNYFRSIPMSLIESARIDGASEWAIMRKIVLPISKPLIGASMAFLGMAAMGDYIWGHLNLPDPRTKTYLVGLMQTTLNVYAVKSIGYNLAVGVMLFIPYFLLFSLSSKYFIGGLTGGAIKE